MAHQITEVTHRSWGNRLRGAFKGILFGMLLVGLASWLLFKNEGRAVRRAKALAEGARTVISVSAASVDPANEGALVHVSGNTDTRETLSDALFGVTERAIHLERQVEMYQWMESTSSSTEKKTGGSTETTKTFSYSTDWSSRAIDSSTFKEPAGHRNPGSLPFSSRKVSAQKVSLGAFWLSASQIESMNAWIERPVSSVAGLAPSLAGKAKLHEGVFYIGIDPVSPSVGDLRVSFRYVPPIAVSLVAAQAGTSFTPYGTRSGGSVQLLRIGAATADQMFEAAREANRVMTWALRLIGFLIMMFGFRIILRPFSVMADVLPALGNLAEKGIGGLAFLVAAPLSLAIVAFAWIFYRPLLGISILLLAGIAIVLLLRRLARARREAPTPPPPPPVPDPDPA